MADRVPNTKAHIPLRCLSCGHAWSATLYNVHVRNSGCPACALKRQGEKQRVSLDDRKKKLNDAGILLLVDHAPGNKDRVPLFCLNCGHEWETVMGAVYNGGTGCPICSRERQADNRRIPLKNHVAALSESGIILLSARVRNLNVNVDLKCMKCNHQWSANLLNIYHNNSGCPSCACSKGSNLIQSILRDNGIAYEIEKRFETCRHKRSLPFDIYIDQLRTLIEFHGPQHRSPIDFFGGQKALESLQERDRIKMKWAQENGYKLIVIHNTTKDVESTLLKFIDRIKNGGKTTLFVSG